MYLFFWQVIVCHQQLQILIECCKRAIATKTISKIMQLTLLYLEAPSPTHTGPRTIVVLSHRSSNRTPLALPKIKDLCLFSIELSSNSHLKMHRTNIKKSKICIFSKKKKKPHKIKKK